jgi:hypothetical protein
MNKVQLIAFAVVVDRQLDRLFARKLLHQRASHSGDEVIGSAGLQPLAHHFAEGSPQILLAGASAPPARRDWHQREAEDHLDSRLGHGFQSAGNVPHRLGAGQAGIAAEQSLGDHLHRCGGGRGRHVAPAPLPLFRCPACDLAEDWDQRIHGWRGEARRDDLALAPPQLAVRAQEAMADRRLQDLLDQLRLAVIRGVVENDVLHGLRVKRDMHRVPEHVAGDVPVAIGSFRPAVDGGFGALAEEAAPWRNRTGATGRVGWNEGIHGNRKVGLTRRRVKSLRLRDRPTPAG